MLPLEIFISHSTQTDEAARFRDSIFNVLNSEPGFKPRLDCRGLDDGGSWRRQLFEWMQNAHGAVLLVSKGALESSFVPIEAAIFAYRQVIRSNFTILPVLIDGARPEDLKKGIFGALAINEISCICPMNPEEAAQRVLAALKKALGERASARTPRELRGEEIAQHLMKSNLSEADLDSIASLPGWRKADPSSENPFYDFASSLLQADFDVACTALRKLIALKTSSAEALLAALKILAPFWVKEDEALLIGEVALSDTSQRLLTLDARFAETPHAYICRAYVMPYNERWQTLTLQPPDQEDSLGSFKSQILASLRDIETYGKIRERNRNWSETRLLEKLITRENHGEPMFTIFPREWRLDSAFLDEIRREFPTLTIMAIAEPGTLNFRSHTIHQLASPGESRESAAWNTYELTLDNIAYWR